MQADFHEYKKISNFINLIKNNEDLEFIIGSGFSESLEKELPLNLTLNKGNSVNLHKKIRNSSEGILFKSLKVNQDPRFDFPVVGEKTLINLRKAKINGLALFENRLILLNKDKLIKLADELDLFIFVVK